MDNKHALPLSDAAFSALDFFPVEASALTGFVIAHADPALGPDGVAMLYGHYPVLGPQLYVFGLSYDASCGISYQRAVVMEE